MTPRASLPKADELFRNTAAEAEATQVQPVQGPVRPTPTKSFRAQVDKDSSPQGPRHEEKVTFYCTHEELTRLERARLALRADHRMAADRGKIVRAAISEALADFEARGAQSALVRQLDSL